MKLTIATDSTGQTWKNFGKRDGWMLVKGTHGAHRGQSWTELNESFGPLVVIG